MYQNLQPVVFRIPQKPPSEPNTAPDRGVRRYRTGRCLKIGYQSSPDRGSSPENREQVQVRLVIIQKNSPGGTGREQAPDPGEKFYTLVMYKIWPLPLSVQAPSPARACDTIRPVCFATDCFTKYPGLTLSEGQFFHPSSRSRITYK